MKTSEILSKALELIADEENWTKGVLWRDKDDNPMHVHWPYLEVAEERPAKFCAAGAVQWVHETALDKQIEGSDAPVMLLRQVRKYGGSEAIETLDVYNDDCTHDDIIRLFEAAIKESLAAESQPGGIAKLLGYEPVQP